ncbi:hypothetical protein VN12_24965 [Pirellula sp. SH-Sr6A]|uniref:hypothetical protein n=1 Tax=Pirellula sp. SH-Sr6A TaxID=1632865 RepID=UPI00078DE682|nr:hypothetical protein [Pirellula sp. SH-Sr6A]AMV35365.1 hypothetical protein VN12_24965 [Pirellula sp. SH-Sr6A]
MMIDYMDRPPPAPDLIKITDIFLVPSSFLVAALGTANTNLHRAVVSVVGLLLNVLWWFSHRIADVQLRIEGAERSLANVNRELADWEKRELFIQEIDEALIDFDRIWEPLTTREKARLLALVVPKVEFDHSDSTIVISCHDSCVESLEQQPMEV